MATSAFKSTTKRTPIGAKSNHDDSTFSSTKAHHRSRSLSRFSHRLPNDDVPRGKFVNTTRGSGFPEICLDDLALEFFPLLKSDEEEKLGRSRPSRRTSEVSPANKAHQTTPSQRRGRSVSRHTARASAGKSGVYDNKTNNNNTNNNSNSNNNNKDDDGANLRRRRRSISVARYHISDSESDKDQSQRSSNRTNVKSFGNGNTRMSSLHKPINEQQLARSHSQKDLLRSNDGYSSHSSAITDDEVKEVHNGKNGVEKTIRAVYAQKKTEHPIGEDVNGGLYHAMRKELRYAVKEIRTEIEQAMVQRNSTLSGTDSLESEKVDVLHAVSAITKTYATKLKQSEKRKQELLAEILLEEQRGKELSKIVKELLPESQSTTLVQSPLQVKKWSNDKSRVSERLTEEAEKYFEDFISSIEDTDISSIDGERSDASSSLGGMHKQREIAPHLVERTGCYQGQEGYNSLPTEMDGVILPWLQWEANNDGSPLQSKMQAQCPSTPKAKMWDANKDLTLIRHSSDRCNSSHGSWSPGVDVGPVVYKEAGRSNCREVGSVQRSRFDMDEYVQLQRNEKLLFERYRERERISSGGLLLCTNHF